MHFAAKHHALVWVAGFLALIGIAFLLVKGGKIGKANVAAANGQGTGGDAGYTVNYTISNPSDTTPSAPSTPTPTPIPVDRPPHRPPPPPVPTPTPIPVDNPDIQHFHPKPTPPPAPSTTPAPSVDSSSIPWFSWFYQDYTTYRNQHGINVPSAPARVTLGSPLWQSYEDWSAHRFAQSS